MMRLWLAVEVGGYRHCPGGHTHPGGAVLAAWCCFLVWGLAPLTVPPARGGAVEVPWDRSAWQGVQALLPALWPEVCGGAASWLSPTIVAGSSSNTGFGGYVAVEPMGHASWLPVECWRA